MFASPVPTVTICALHSSLNCERDREFWVWNLSSAPQRDILFQINVHNRSKLVALELQKPKALSIPRGQHDQLSGAFMQGFLACSRLEDIPVSQEYYLR